MCDLLHQGQGRLQSDNSRSCFSLGWNSLLVFAASLSPCSRPFLHHPFGTGFLWFLARKSVVTAQYVPSAVSDFCLDWHFQGPQNICCLSSTSSSISPGLKTTCTKYLTRYRWHHVSPQTGEWSAYALRL